jgi:predicted GNAT superfamily acetyltransferase
VNPEDTTVRLLHRPDELGVVDAVLREIWGTGEPLVALEMLVAIAHTGGYVAVAEHGGRVVGASVGLLARHDGRPALHSHVTGLLPTARGLGVGRLIKLHQRRWALAHDLGTITWTFDPLVRRNAWFNVAVLGADVLSYLPSFYGAMNDAINAGDDSDRLLVAWDLRRPIPVRPRVGDDVPDPVVVPTPDDVVALRRTDPAAVARWRVGTRAAFLDALGAGRSVAGFTTTGDYVLGSPP